MAIEITTKSGPIPSGHMGKAFTLIEMLLALTLAAMLAAATMGVVSRMRLGLAAQDTAAGAAGLDDDLEAMVLLDLDHARRYRVAPTGLEIETRTRLDAVGNVEHLPVRVVYESRRLGGRHWLLRRQISPRGPVRSDLVEADVVALTLRPPGRTLAETRGAWQSPRKGAVLRIERTEPKFSDRDVASPQEDSTASERMIHPL